MKIGCAESVLSSSPCSESMGIGYGEPQVRLGVRNPCSAPRPAASRGVEKQSAEVAWEQPGVRWVCGGHTMHAAGARTLRTGRVASTTSCCALPNRPADASFHVVLGRRRWVTWCGSSVDGCKVWGCMLRMCLEAEVQVQGHGTAARAPFPTCTCGQQESTQLTFTRTPSSSSELSASSPPVHHSLRLQAAPGPARPHQAARAHAHGPWPRPTGSCRM